MARTARPITEPIAAGKGIAETRERQALRQANQDNAIPAFLRPLKHLDNGGTGYEVTSAAVLTIPHGLGRPHKGVIFTQKAVSAGAPTVDELRSDHASYNAALAATHVQLRSNSVNAVTVKVMVF